LSPDEAVIDRFDEIVVVNHIINSHVCACGAQIGNKSSGKVIIFAAVAHKDANRIFHLSPSFTVPYNKISQ
jgi:hypothetical protein